jgi:hypothetical protein
MALMAFGYLHAGPAVMGKRDDGRRWWWAAIVHAPCLVVLSLVWRLGRVLRPEPAWNLIAPGIYVGRWVPGVGALPPGIGMIVDLAAEHTEPHELVECCRYRSLPTLDGTSLTDPRYAGILAEASRYEGAIYIHCAVGHSRSAMFAAGVLVVRGLCDSLDASLATMESQRPSIYLRPSQRRLSAASPGLVAHASAEV